MKESKAYFCVKSNSVHLVFSSQNLLSIYGVTLLIVFCVKIMSLMAIDNDTILITVF